MNEERKDEEQPQIPEVLPVLPLRDIVIFPFMIVPLYVSRDKSIKAVDQALAENRMILLAAQKSQDEDDPTPDDIYGVGTVALIMRMLKLPDGRIRVLVQGLSRARTVAYEEGHGHLQARIETVSDPELTEEGSLEVEALMRNVKGALEQSQNLGKPISPEVVVIANNMDEAGRLADLTASNLDTLKVEGAQAILEALDPVDRLRRVHELMTKELEVLNMQQEISSQAQGEMDRSQREYFLRQQLKAIQIELGEGNELAEEIAPATARRPARRRCPSRVLEEVERQIKQLERMHPDAPRPRRPRNYLDWLVTAPLEQDDQGQPRPRRSPANPGRRPLRARQGQGAHRRVPRGAQAEVRDEGADTLLRRPARRRQDLPRAVDRTRPGPQVRPPVAGRGARRGGDPRPPAHLRRAPCPGASSRASSRPAPTIRSSCSTRSTSSAPTSGAIPARRCWRCSTPSRTTPSATTTSECLRPVARHVHHHRQPPRHHPAGVPRPDGGHPPARLHRGREARHRQAAPGAQAARGARTRGRAARLHRQRPASHRELVHPGGRAAQPRA